MFDLAQLDTPAPITLEIHICDQRRSYLAGFATEDQALAFLQARSSTHAFQELPGGSFDYDANPRLVDLLYPLCEHGLSADLCAGYGHYPSDRPGW